MINDVYKWAEIHTNSKFFETINKQVLFVENEGARVYYFRAPLMLARSIILNINQDILFAQICQMNSTALP